MYLEETNAHPRDARIRFVEDTHTYYVDDEPVPLSVTGFVHKAFEVFDGERILNRMNKSRRMAKYGKRTNEEIMAEWAAKGKEASEAGTKMHDNIELFYNNEPTIDFEGTPEQALFLKFHADFKHLTPYRSEWRVFSEPDNLAGSIDMVFENADGDLLIYDWKRCKDVTPTPAFRKYSHLEGLEHVLDCKFFHYSLQLNTYKYMVERAYGKKVVELALVVLHPDQETYQFSPIADMTDEVRTLMMHRHVENWVRDDHVAATKEDEAVVVATKCVLEPTAVAAEPPVTEKRGPGDDLGPVLKRART